MSTTKEELESKACLEKRERLFRKLQKTYDMVKLLPTHEDVFVARFSQAEEELKMFNEIQDKLARLNLVIPTSEQVPIDAPSDSYDELYYIVAAKCKEILGKKEQPPSIVSETPAQDTKSLRPKLPPIEIPKFKGDLEKFPAFKSLYDTLVHNTELTLIQKFSFLKSYVEYPASCVIENFDFTDENYQLAYDTLVERYTEKRLVGTHFLKKLFQFKPLTSSSPDNLRKFLDVFCVHYESLKSLKIADLSDFVVLYLAMKVLDSDTKRLFEDKHSQKAFPSFNDLMLFVKEQYKVASIVQAPIVNKPSTSFTKPQANQKGLSSSKPSYNTKAFMSNSHDQKIKCPVCKQDHKLYFCEKFKGMTPFQRLEIAKRLKLCFACLGSHDRSSCRSKYVCRFCKEKNHHSLLHRDQSEAKNGNPESQDSQKKAEDGPSEESSINVLSCNTQPLTSRGSSTTGLLGTVKCCIQSQAGDWVEARMVVDPASESSFITESLVQALKLPRRKYSVDIVGVGSSMFPNNRGCVTCKVSPRHTFDHTLSVEAIVLQTISSNLPKVPLEPNVRKRFSSLHLADPDFDRPGRIDLLLGVQHYSEILSESVVHIKGDPAALDTIFGFLIFGKIPSIQGPKESVSMLTHTAPLDDMLRRFWEAEEPPQVVSKDVDRKCEKFFSETTTRDSLGRYHVSLPFKETVAPDTLGSTREVALKRLLSLERSLSRNTQLKEGYHANLQDYIDQDHMRPAPTESEYLLTHHAVVKESTTTKVRVVFNGSEKSDTHKSLNEYLSPGSKLQTDISVILSSFRMQPVALTADIKQMYRCIRLNPSDTKYTHVLWRSDLSQPIREWVLTTLPFGLTSSPYLALKTIKQLVCDEGQPFPSASQALLSNTYIDDIVCCVSSESEAVLLYHKLTNLLQKGGFTLHKVASNKSNVMSHIPSDSQEKSVSFESSDCIKLLGFLWDPSQDVFFYTLSLESPTTTKRGILSQVARIYDINGYLSPITFWIKHFIQLLWLAGIEWDEDLPLTLKQSWLLFYSQLGEITHIQIPRYISSKHPSVITIVAFCDASEKGYGSCVYLRTQSKCSQTQVHLLKAKSKVAPLKTVTIPKLELNGALLLAKLLHSLKDFLSTIPQYQLYCFTDSATVLAWLRKPPHLLKTYVSNRVVQILDLTPPSSWKHVSSKQNPADLASRGLFPSQLSNNDLWWHGPSFLSQPIADWPMFKVPPDDPLPECKPDTTSFLATPQQPESNECFIESCECLLYTATYGKEYGTFSSPDYPRNYPPSINCLLYTFVASKDEIIEIVFKDFDVQKTHLDCFRGDFVKLFLHLESGEVNEYTPWSGLLCGGYADVPHVFYSSGPGLVLEFHTDHIQSNSSGFIGTFRFIDRRMFQNDGQKLPGTQCDHQFISSNFTPSYGRFYSPRYPSSYPKHIMCAYRFRARPKERIRVVFEEVTLEKGDVSCLNRADLIKVHDGRGSLAPAITVLCNEAAALEVLSTGPDLYIEFVSNSDWPGQGFKATFQFQPLEALNSDTPYSESTRLNVIQGSSSSVQKNFDFGPAVSATMSEEFDVTEAVDLEEVQDTNVTEVAPTQPRPRIIVCPKGRSNTPI